MVPTHRCNIRDLICSNGAEEIRELLLLLKCMSAFTPQTSRLWIGGKKRASCCKMKFRNLCGGDQVASIYVEIFILRC